MNGLKINPLISVLAIVVGLLPIAHVSLAHEGWMPSKYSPEDAHEPSPLPDRVVLTWEDDPATTQSVTWRTDTSVKRGVAEIALASANGRAMKPDAVQAVTTVFESDINDAHYHSAIFRNLQPDTLYAYRVGDGENWTEYYHFKTASDRARPFSFIYFGDAQNDVRTHWSRVFREAFRDSPRAAFTLHAGDLIDVQNSDAEWGDWHQGPDWVNATIPVIATPGNHEYRRVNEGSRAFRYWSSASGETIDVTMTGFEEVETDAGKVYQISLIGPWFTMGSLELNDGGRIIKVDEGVIEISGFTEEVLLGSSIYKPPLQDRQREPGEPAVTTHWRPQFAFPVEEGIEDALKETVYAIDYQGVRFISLNSNEAIKSQIPWLRSVLEDNPNRWTVVTFHHPVFSPASDRDNAELRNLWKPILDEFKVDLVLNGHDHTYARTGQVDASALLNVPTGYQQAYDPNIGTVYVVSVSGPKMYEITKGSYAKRVAEDTQLYQIIDINDKSLRYRAFTATGALYDAFTLEKRRGQPNKLIEAQTLPAESRRQ